MHQNVEILPPELHDFSLPPGLEWPRNVVMTEGEAADFLRLPEHRLRSYRYDGAGPTFTRPEGETMGARYLVWDLLAWAVRNRRAAMPNSSRRRSRQHAERTAA